MDESSVEKSQNDEQNNDVRYDTYVQNSNQENKGKNLRNYSHVAKTDNINSPNGSAKENNNRHGNQTDKRSLVTKLKTDEEYRRKYILTFSIFCSFIVLGWSSGQAGPALLDLQHITNVSLSKASALFTAGTIAYLFAALGAGFVFDRVKNAVVLPLVCVLGLGVSTAVVPWMSVYAWMVFVHVIRGAVGGGIDTSGNALLFRTWGTDGKMFMQALHFGYALGGAISPLAIAPFLLPDEEDDPAQNLINVTTITPTSNASGVPTQEEESILYIGFSISAGVALLLSVPICFSVIQAHFAIKKYGTIKLPEQDNSEAESNNRPQNLSKGMKIIVVSVLLSLFLPYVAVESSFSSFLTTFCVKELKWTKVNGALITSAFWGAFAAGRLLGVVVTALFSLVTLIFTYATFLLLCFVAILLCTLFNFDTGMWIFSPLLGLSMSVIFPCIFTWTEEAFVPVTGFISSLFIVGSMVISSINPLLLGFLMDNYTSRWFVYLLLGESIVLYGLLIIVYFLSKIISKPRHQIEIAVK